MPGIAEGLPRVLREISEGRVRGVPPEARSRIGQWVQQGELPSLPALAEILESLNAGFGSLEVECRTRGPVLLGESAHRRPKVSPRLLVSRLDVGLRSLRGARGMTQAQVAEVADVKAHYLSAWERPETGERPSVEELDRLLRAVRASYDQLEGAVADPFRAYRALERRFEREKALVVRGQVAHEAVQGRFDVALRALRGRRGWTRRELAEASGVSAGRIQTLETWSLGVSASEEEATALVEALEVSLEELEVAARNPLQDLGLLERKLRAARRELARRGPTRIGRVKAPQVVTERLDLALQVLRSRKGWSRKALAERANVPPERVTAMETWGGRKPPSPEEAEALRQALGAEMKDLEDAARWPLRAISWIRRETLAQRRKLEVAEASLEAAMDELERAREIEGEPKGPVYVATCRVAESMIRVRRLLAERD